MQSPYSYSTAETVSVYATAERPMEAARTWSTLASRKQRRLERAAAFADGPVLKPERIGDALTALIEPGDRVALEGDNQKQADFLSRVAGQGSIPAKRARPAPADLQHQPARASRPVRARHRPQGRLLLRRPAEPARGAVARGRQARDRRDPHLCRAVCPDVRRPDAAAWRWSAPSRPTGTATSTPAPNTEDTPTIVEATAFRARHRGRAGQRDRRRSCRASTSRPPGSISWSRPTGPSRSSRCSPATRAISASCRS